MLHLDEVFAAEIYARNAIVVGDVKRVEGSRETMGFTRRFLWYFLFADEKKVRTFRVKGLTTTPQSALRLTAPLTRGAFDAAYLLRIFPLHKGGFRFSNPSNDLPSKKGESCHAYTGEKN